VAAPAGGPVGVLIQIAVNLPGHRTGRLPYRLGKRHEVVRGGRRRFELALMPYDLPAAGSGEAARVGLAQVVRVGFWIGRERSDHGGRVVVDVGQRRDRLPGAAVTGATPW
jgi:hypothetical protein